MIKLIQQYPIALVGAVVVHAVILGVFFVHLDDDTPEKKATPPHIEAVAVQAQAYQNTLKQAAKVEQARLQAAEEKKRTEVVREKAKLKAKKAADEKARRALAKEKRRQQNAKKIALEKRKQRLAEQKRKAIQAKKDQQLRAEEAKRKRKAAKKAKREAEKKRQARKQRQQRQTEMERQIALEEAEQREKTIGRFIGKITEKIGRKFRPPPGFKAGMSCDIQVKILPGGEVDSVKIIKSSGNARFDRSVATAVYKASPLPTPSDVLLFQAFRSITMTFTPKK